MLGVEKYYDSKEVFGFLFPLYAAPLQKDRNLKEIGRIIISKTSVLGLFS